MIFLALHFARANKWSIGDEIRTPAKTFQRATLTSSLPNSQGMSAAFAKRTKASLFEAMLCRGNKLDIAEFRQTILKYAFLILLQRFGGRLINELGAALPELFLLRTWRDIERFISKEDFLCFRQDFPKVKRNFWIIGFCFWKMRLKKDGDTIPELFFHCGVWAEFQWTAKSIWIKEFGKCIQTSMLGMK